LAEQGRLYLPGELLELSTTLEAVLRRDRWIVGAALAGVAVLAWAYMIHEARVMEATSVCSCFGMQMSGPDMQPWAASQLTPLFLMWTEMMVAMMIPSAAPTVLLFATVNRRRREQARPFVPAGLFLLGYLAVWTFFSAAAAVAQWALHAWALLSPMMVGTSPLFGGGLLILAGIFQFTPFKSACLAHCRSPLAFLTSEWREGRAGAFAMGVKHGAFCTGCCWVLMALLFVAGVMNMWWVAAITALVLIEKVLPRGLWLGRIAGAGFIAWGVWLAGSWSG
jgi:predicted metal-binding membrane protein